MTAREENEKDGTVEEKLIDFIRTNIKQLECGGYKKREETKKEIELRKKRGMRGKNPDDCHCGRLTMWHEIPYTDSNFTVNTWKAKPAECNCFGEITFDGYGAKTNKAKYLRLDKDTKPELVWTLLTNHWNLSPPKCVLSIMAGFEYYTHSSELKTILKQRLTKAVQATEAWIITGGRANGLIGILGTAVQDCEVLSRDKSTQRQPVLLGIPHWCFTENTSVLEGTNPEKKPHQATYSKDSTKTTRALDHNHTHFLLADDGRNDELCPENPLRINLEKHIREDKVIPSVTIIMSGDHTTTDTLKILLEERIPVVIVDGSGYYADFLAYAYRITERGGETSKENFISLMKRKAEEVFGLTFQLNDLKLENLKLENLNKYLTGDQRKLLHIFELNNTDSEQDLDRVIVNALLKASDKFDMTKKLELAQAWNRFDFVQEEIFTPLNDDKIDLLSPMITALENDQPEFVKLFIDEGLNLNAQFTTEDLCKLYSRCFKDQGSEESDLMNRLLKRVCYVHPDVEKSSNPSNDQETPQENVEHEKTPLKKSKEKQSKEKRNKQKHSCSHFLKCIGAMVSHLLRDARFNVYSGSTEGTDKKKKDLFEDLLIWATLFNRTRMVNLFWMKGKDQIKWALFSAALSKSLSKVALQKKKEKLSRTYIRNSLFYEKCASTVLSKSDDMDRHENRHWTHLLLVREVTFATKMGSNPRELCGTSALMMAESYKPIIFTGEPVCQATLNSIWKGSMAPLTPLWLIVLCIIFPPFTIFVEFTGQKTVSDHNHKLRKVQPSLCRGDKTCPGGNNSCENNSGCSDKVNYLEAFLLLFNAPVSKFICNLVAYLVFLTTFSYHLLVELDASREPSILEYFIYVWILTMMIEEARQMYARKTPLFRHKLSNWFDSKWNILDILMYLLLLTSIGMRFSLDSYIKWVTVVYSLTLILFFMRLMQYFYANEYLGPWVIIVSQMFFDMLAFTLLLLVFVVSFGIAYHANMYPHYPPSWSILGNVLYLPYFQIYGHIFLEHLDESKDGCTVNETIWRNNPELRCPSKNFVVPILMALYVMLTMILLTNLLIAMFSDTISKKRDESTHVWKYYWMTFVYEYSERPTLVPPFIILNHFFRFINYFYQKHFPQKQQNDDPFILKMTPEDDERLTQFERICMEHSQLKLKQLLRDFEVETAEKDPDTEEQKYEQMKRKMKRLKEQIDQIAKALALRHNQVENTLTKIVSLLEKS